MPVIPALGMVRQKIMSSKPGLGVWGRGARGMAQVVEHQRDTLSGKNQGPGDIS
jgi:hypothetical protein